MSTATLSSAASPVNPTPVKSAVSPIVSKQEILAKVASGQMAIERASELLGTLGAKPASPLHCKVSAEKKCLSLYGVNSRRPVSLYAAQWERVLDYADEIRAFIVAHPELARKGV